MANTCTVCRHEKRPAIDERLLARVPLHTLVEETGLSLGALHRHKEAHLSGEVLRAHEAHGQAEAISLMERVEKMIADCQRIAGKAEDAKAWSGAASALREVGRCLELLGRLTGQLDRGKVNVGIQVLNIGVAGGDPELEIAKLMAAVTNNFDQVEIERFKALLSEPLPVRGEV